MQVSNKSPWMSRSAGDDEDEPPALPAEPPPAPNWNTFPSPSGRAAADSFLDNSDVLPDTSTTEVNCLILRTSLDGSLTSHHRKITEQLNCNHM